MGLVLRGCSSDWVDEFCAPRRLQPAHSPFRCDLLEPCGQVLVDVVWVRGEDLGFAAGFAGDVGAVGDTGPEVVAFSPCSDEEDPCGRVITKQLRLSMTVCL
jgi:hypothetical protein